jgi:hypothetical protein
MADEQCLLSGAGVPVANEKSDPKSKLTQSGGARSLKDTCEGHGLEEVAPAFALCRPDSGFFLFTAEDRTYSFMILQTAAHAPRDLTYR